MRSLRVVSVEIDTKGYRKLTKEANKKISELLMSSINELAERFDENTIKIRITIEAEGNC